MYSRKEREVKLKEELKAVRTSNSKWREDYFTMQDKVKLLELQIKERREAEERQGFMYSKFITDLKLILAGTVCKDNPFVNKELVRTNIGYPEIPMFPSKNNKEITL